MEQTRRLSGEAAGVARTGAKLLRALSLPSARRQPRPTIGASGRTAERRRADYHLFWPASAYREDHSILVAGCGTSQAAKHALRWPAARVTGIDFSATSVRCTEDAQAKVRARQPRGPPAPDRARRRARGALRSDRLHRRAASPARPRRRGSRALRDVLAPDGAMHLMVYAPYGRTGIYMLQEFCRRRRHRRHRRGHPRSRRRARGAAAGTSARDAAARGARLSGRGGARRCAAAPAGSRLLGAAAVRVPRRAAG